MTHWRQRQTGRQAFSFRVIDSYSVRIKERLTDNGVVVVQVFGEPLLGYGLLIELDTSLWEEVVVGLITCGGELVVLGTRLLSGSAHGCCLPTSRKVKSRRKCWKLKRRKVKESEEDGEVDERATQRAHETWRWPWDGMRDTLEPLSSLEPWALSHSVMCKESNEDGTKETQKNKQTKGTHEPSVGALVRVHKLQVCVNVKHVVVLVVLLCVINSVVVSVPTYSLFTCMRIPCTGCSA